MKQNYSECGTALLLTPKEKLLDDIGIYLNLQTFEWHVNINLTKTHSHNICVMNSYWILNTLSGTFDCTHYQILTARLVQESRFKIDANYHRHQ